MEGSINIGKQESRDFKKNLLERMQTSKGMQECKICESRI